MNNRTKITTFLLLLVLSVAWLDLVVAKGPSVKVKVEQAVPGEAEQGQQVLAVKIKGSGFKAGDTVHFLVAGTKDETQINVSVAIYDAATGDLDTIINVIEAATIADYDIEIRRSGGRGGKGTGLFKVKGKGGGKPPPDPEPPPPEPIDGTACVDSSGDFPALAYFDRVRVGKGRKIKKIATVYIANSDGSCSIPIWTGEDYGSAGGGFTFQLIENTGHILWGSNTGEIFRWQFDIENRAIKTILPLGLPEVVFRLSEVGLGQTILSPDGNEIYFPQQVFDPAGEFATINVIDLETCANLPLPLPCSATRILTMENGGIASLTTSPDGSRIYFVLTNIPPDDASVSFIERDSNGTWSGIKDVVTNKDPGYEQYNFASGALWNRISVALVDYPAGPIEMLAFNRADGDRIEEFIDLLSVADCDIIGEEGSCFANGNAALVGRIEGELVEFTSYTSDSAGMPTTSILIQRWRGDDLDWAFEEWDPRNSMWIREILVGLHLNNIWGLPQSGD